jgi:hypothetical protein
MGKQYVSDRVYFDGTRRFKAGEVFSLGDNVRPAKCMTPVAASEVKPAKAKAQKAKASEPETFSEMAQVEGEAQGNALV